MDFEDVMDYSNSNSNLVEGQALLLSLETADLTESMSLAKGDGAVDGAFYLLYTQLVENGLIEPLDMRIFLNDNIPGQDIIENCPIITAMPILKLIMYHCFVMGAESMKGV